MVTSSRLKELLHYDLQTGVFTWKVKRNQNTTPGSRAGTLHPNKRRSIWIDGIQYYEHRLAWLYVYGKFPDLDVDHIDRDPEHNWISNLRDVTESVNLQNQRLTSRKNSSGLLGVTWYPNRGMWVAVIKANGKSKTLGYYQTKEDAFQAYLSAKRFHHPGFVEA